MSYFAEWIPQRPQAEGHTWVSRKYYLHKARSQKHSSVSSTFRRIYVVPYYVSYTIYLSVCSIDFRVVSFQEVCVFPRLNT